MLFNKNGMKTMKGHVLIKKLPDVGTKGDLLMADKDPDFRGVVLHVGPPSFEYSFFERLVWRFNPPFRRGDIVLFPRLTGRMFRLWENGEGVEIFIFHQLDVKVVFGREDNHRVTKEVTKKEKTYYHKALENRSFE